MILSKKLNGSVIKHFKEAAVKYADKTAIKSGANIADGEIGGNCGKKPLSCFWLLERPETYRKEIFACSFR
jgi:hypothetical protein